MKVIGHPGYDDDSQYPDDEQVTSDLRVVADLTRQRDAAEEALERVVAGYEQRMALIHWWSEPRESQSAGKPTLVVAQEFIAYYSGGGGCSNCGGLPHTTTCFVGRFQRALGAVPVEDCAVDRVAETGQEADTRDPKSSSSSPHGDA